jgi:hypothetical protein
VTGISPTGAADERRMVFDATNLTDGIDLSADPILAAPMEALKQENGFRVCCRC